MADENEVLLTTLGVAGALAELCKVLVAKGVLSSPEVVAALNAAEARIEANGRETGTAWESAVVPIVTIRQRFEGLNGSGPR